MSSYLTFYIVPKEEGSQPIPLISYTRSSDVYQYYKDNAYPAFIGNGDEPEYSEVTLEKMDWVLEDLRRDINKATSRMSEYEKHAAGNMDIIEEIISQKEYVSDLQYALNKLEFIRDIVEESTHSWTEFDKVLCNVD